MAGLDLKGGLAAAAALAALAGCGTGGDPETLGGRLQGNWVCDRAYPEAGFLRRDEAKMDVHATSIHFNYNVSWSCDSIAPCPG